MKRATLQIWIFLAAAALLPLFWVPVASVGGIKLDLNGLGFFIMVLIFPFFLRHTIMILAPVRTWAVGAILFYIFFLLIDVLVHQGEIFRLLTFQIVFLAVSLQLGVLASILLNGNPSPAMRRLILGIPALSFAFVLLVQNGLPVIGSMLVDLVQLNGIELFHDTRRIFFGAWVERLGFEDVASNPNRVSQHMVAMALMMFGFVALFRMPPRRVPLIFLFIAFLLFYPVVIRSGQAILQLAILGLFILLRYLKDFNLARGMIIIYFGLIFLALSGMILADTPTMQSLIERLSGDNFSTGRDRIIRSVVNGNAFHPLFGFEHTRIDTHNFFLTMLAYFGVVGVFFFAFLLVGLWKLMRYFMTVKPQNDRDFLETLLLGMLASLPLQFFVAIIVNGGFGMPSWSEIYKLAPLFAYFHSRANEPSAEGIENWASTRRRRSFRLAE